MSPYTRWLKRIAVAIAILAGLLGAFLFSVHEPRPKGVVGARADEVARSVQEAVDVAAFAQVGAIAFEFGGRHKILWDRTRRFARVEDGDLTIDLRLDDRTGRVRRGQVPIEDPAILAKAYGTFINDTFWLNPFVSFFDDGVERAMVGNDLLVTYGSGGTTPGDAYLWTLDEQGLPVRWKMWVSIIPVGGLEVTWEAWLLLPGGAKVSTHHDFVRPFGLTGVSAAATLSELEPQDPFSDL